jgi:hypothetical protein
MAADGSCVSTGHDNSPRSTVVTTTPHGACVEVSQHIVVIVSLFSESPRAAIDSARSRTSAMLGDGTKF